MDERERPEIGRVRDALRQHDERHEEEESEATPPPERQEAPEGSPDDGEDEREGA